MKIYYHAAGRPVVGPYLPCLLAVLAAMSAAAKTFTWRITGNDARAAQFAAYHGETVAFDLEFALAASNCTAEAAQIYYQTNGMAEAWWQTRGLVFAPSNDVGAASYRFFVRATDDLGANYTANGILRMLDSPGFAPSALPLPVKTLDFDAVEVFNAPWPAEIDAAAQAATNYTDSVASGKQDALTPAQLANIAAVPDKADKSELADYLPLAGGIITGNVTATGLVTVVQDVDIGGGLLLETYIPGYGIWGQAELIAGGGAISGIRNGRLTMTGEWYWPRYDIDALDVSSRYYTIPVMGQVDDATNATLAAAAAYVTNALSSHATFDFATTGGFMAALKAVIETLGGSVTNFPAASSN